MMQDKIIKMQIRDSSGEYIGSFEPFFKDAYGFRFKSANDFFSSAEVRIIDFYTLVDLIKGNCCTAQNYKSSINIYHKGTPADYGMDINIEGTQVNINYYMKYDNNTILTLLSLTYDDRYTDYIIE